MYAEINTGIYWNLNAALKNSAPLLRFSFVAMQRTARVDIMSN